MAPKSTGLALLESKSGKIAKPTARDRNFYLLSRRGWSTAELAVRFSTKEPVVRMAIERYQIHRDSLSNDEQDLALAEMVQRAMPKVERVLDGALKATSNELYYSKGKNPKQKVRKVADHATRLQAVEKVRAFVETSRPKGGGITVNTQVNNQQDGGAPATISKGYDFESHLREIRERKGLANEMPVIDGQLEEEEDGGLSAELAEIGVELDEDDDDEDGDDEEDDE